MPRGTERRSPSPFNNCGELILAELIPAACTKRRPYAPISKVRPDLHALFIAAKAPPARSVSAITSDVSLAPEPAIPSS